jgi:hypothetical protein
LCRIVTKGTEVVEKNVAGSIRKESPRTELVQNWAESEKNEEKYLKILQH